MESGNKAASNKSLIKFPSIGQKVLKERLDNSIGVGLRFFFKKNLFNYDGKIEPYLADTSYFFSQLTDRSDLAEYPIREVFNKVEEVTNYFKGDWFNFLKDELLI